MDPATRIRVFGTDEPLPAVTVLAAGPLVVEVAAGAVRSVRWRGIEILRGIDYPVRDADWGTYSQTTVDERETTDESGFRYERRFLVGDGAIDGRFSLAGSATRLEAKLDLAPRRPMRVNRAGLVVLHPVADLAGCPLDVTHSDGRVEHARFPERIAPAQPVFDIAALSHAISGIDVEIQFKGDVFEMEDQRNWSDASYKTYCRPLSLPYPHDLDQGTPVSQSVTLTFSGEGTTAGGAADTAVRIGNRTGRLPEVTLSIEPGWEADGAAIETLAVASTRLRLDATRDQWRRDLEHILATAKGAVDLEMIVPDDPSAIDAVLTEIAQLLAARSRSPRMVMALPAAYLMSYQPDAHWPNGATPEAAAAAVRRYFPASTVMGGMLTNFTELNRYRSAAGSGDVLTHGTTAIVHAADDLSVVQTLEALPQIFDSAVALAPDRPYHLGLVAIGMRSNPYGAGLARNADGVRRPMADADPRQRGQFAAAWMVGAMAATEGTRVAGLSLAAPAGPMGLVEDGIVRPAYHVFSFLARLSGCERLAVRVPTGSAAIAVRERDGIALVLANLTAEPRSLALRGQALILPSAPTLYDWLDTATPIATERLDLDPYGVAFVWLDDALAEGTS